MSLCVVEPYYRFLRFYRRLSFIVLTLMIIVVLSEKHVVERFLGPGLIRPDILKISPELAFSITIPLLVDAVL